MVCEEFLKNMSCHCCQLRLLFYWMVYIEEMLFKKQELIFYVVLRKVYGGCVRQLLCALISIEKWKFIAGTCHTFLKNGIAFFE